MGKEEVCTIPPVYRIDSFLRFWPARAHYNLFAMAPMLSTLNLSVKSLNKWYTQGSRRQTEPKKGQFMNFSGGIPEQKFNVNRACFPKEKHQSSRKCAKFMNFSFWPFLWFGLLGRLLIHTPSMMAHQP